MGVRTDVPFARADTPRSADIVFDGPAGEDATSSTRRRRATTFAELDFTYYQRRLHRGECAGQGQGREGPRRAWRSSSWSSPAPTAAGTRLNERRTGPHAGAARTWPQATAHDAGRAPCRWVRGRARHACPRRCSPWRTPSADQFLHTGTARLMELGLGYLALDRAGATLSTGERQRVQLARAVRNRTTGVLYVLDEPSIGLHPANVDGLLGVMRRPRGRRQLGGAGGPRRAGAAGGRLARRDGARRGARRRHAWCRQGARGRGGARTPTRCIGPLLDGHGRAAVVRERTAAAGDMFDAGAHPARHRAPAYRACRSSWSLPEGRLVAVTGRIGLGQDHARAGKPGARPCEARLAGEAAAQPCARASTPRTSTKARTSSTPRPSGRNVRSTVATYSDVLDDLRSALRRAPPRRKERGLKARGLLVQHGLAALPRLRRHGTDIARRAVPARRGHRMPRRAAAPATRPAASEVHYAALAGAQLTLPQVMAFTVDEAADALAGERRVGAQAGNAARPGTGLSHARRGHAQRSRAARRSA